MFSVCHYRAERSVAGVCGVRNVVLMVDIFRLRCFNGFYSPKGVGGLLNVEAVVVKIAR